MDDHLASSIMDDMGGFLESPLLNSSDYLSPYLQPSDMYMKYTNPNFCQMHYQEDDTETKPFETCPFDYPTRDAFSDNQAPRRRLFQAIEFLRECTREMDILIQLWLPVTRGSKLVLATDNHPFILNSDSTDLSCYREISRTHHFATNHDSNDLFGLPALVYLNKFPMCTPDFQYVGQEDDPRVQYAQKLNLYGSLSLPVFGLGSGTCLGVVEIVTDSQEFNYRKELENISTALEAVDLRSSEFLIPPKLEDCNGSYQTVLGEIRQVLKSVCDIHNLPLAQTWGLCSQQGKGGCQQLSAACISTLHSASYVFDPKVLGFYEACSMQHLLRGEGIAGKALETNEPCFTTDITTFCRTEYPLAHHARMFGLSSAVAIRLRSTFMGPIDFILEFFMPHDCKNYEEQKQMLSSISSVIQHVSQSLRVINDEELVEADSFSVKETASAGDGSSWISHLLEAQQRGESVIVSMGYHKEEPEEEFKVINQWNDHETGFCHGNTFGGPEKKTQLESRPTARIRSSGTRRPSKERQQRNISLQVLKQYFPGSLKDAAKSIGVCPTTLKRICRTHGIMRWPSRKIKKVGHSLKKLQLIIDSVQGAEGTIQLGSFYTNFPELSSQNSPSPTSIVNDRVKLLKSQTKSSSSSSGSENSGSSLCCSSGNTLDTEKFTGLLKRPCSDSSFLKDSHQNDFVDHHQSPEVLVPVQKSNLPILRDGDVFHVKAAYGGEKIRLSMSEHWGFVDLKREITRRFNIDDMDNIITLKYFDDDSEWVLLTCDADLEECMDLHISSKKKTIKLFVHQSSHPELGSSFTGKGSS